ncbi:MAG: WD40 domain-containing protein, partial [Planctomycetota bacterium]
SYGMLRRITDTEPRPIREINPDVPEWLCRIIARLMSKQPDDRFESAREVAELLEECLAHVQQPTAVPLPVSLAPQSRVHRVFSGSRRNVGVIAMIAAFGVSLLGMVLWQATAPPDIAGKWTGEGWGAVVLEAKQPGQYEGSYTDSGNAKSGTVHLKWSRLERRFNGTWQEGNDRDGKISVRLVDDEIRGAWTTGEDSQKESGTPRLADLLWTRSSDNKKQRAEAAANALRAEAVAKAQSEKAKLAFAFLSDVPEFRNLDLSVTEDRLKQFVEEHHLISRVTRTEKATTYTLYSQKGECVNVMFYDGKCSGIQRLRADPGFGRRVDLPVPADAMPKRIHHFTVLTTGNDVKIAYSADGKLIAVANGNPSLIRGQGWSRVKDNWKPSADILDAETGKTVVSLKLSTPDVDALLAATQRVSHCEATALAFSPDGDVVAVGTSIGQVRLFNARTGELVRSLDDEGAKLADQDTPENWKSLRRAMGSVASLAFSPDGSLLAMCGTSFGDFSGGLDGVYMEGFPGGASGPGRLKVWDVQTGTLKHDLAGHNSHTTAVAFSPDGRLLASAGRWWNKGDSGDGVILWNPHTGTQIRSFRTTASSGALSVAFSPDSKRLAMGTQHFDSSNPNNPSTGGVSLVQVSTGNVDWLQTVPRWAKPVAFSPDGENVAVLCGGSIRFLETATGTMEHEIRPADSPQGGHWNDFAIAPQGHMLAIGGLDDERKGSVEVWSTRSGGEEKVPGTVDASTTKADLKRRLALQVIFVNGAARRLLDQVDGLTADKLQERIQLDRFVKKAFVDEPPTINRTGQTSTNFDTATLKSMLEKLAELELVEFGPQVTVEPADGGYAPIHVRSLRRYEDDAAWENTVWGVERRETKEGRVGFSLRSPAVPQPGDESPYEPGYLRGIVRFLPNETAIVRWYFHWVNSENREEFRKKHGGEQFILLGLDHRVADEAEDQGGEEKVPGTVDSRSTGNTNESRSTSRPKTASAMPKRVHHFTSLTTGNNVRIACSADGKLIAIANGNPTRIGNRLKDNWKPSTEILDAETGKTVVSLQLTTGDEDTLLAAAERSHFEVTALALSPDGSMVAVGTSVGQVKLFNARTGELVRPLDDKGEKLADKKTPEHLKWLSRAMGSVTSLAFSPDGSLLATCGRSFDDSPLVREGMERLREFSTGPGRLKVWEVKTGTLKHDLVGHSHADAVSFSPDGNLLASAGRWSDEPGSGTGVIIWNP